MPGDFGCLVRAVACMGLDLGHSMLGLPWWDGPAEVGLGHCGPGALCAESTLEEQLKCKPRGCRALFIEGALVQ